MRHTPTMSVHLASTRGASRRRTSWIVFAVGSVLGLGACVVLALTSGSRSSLGLTLIGGLVMIGVAAALLHSILSPIRDEGGRTQTLRAHRGFGGGGLGGDGIFDGGGSHGGDGGGGGGGDG